MDDGARLHSRVGGVPGTDGASTASTVGPLSEPDTSSPSDRLRWIADYLDLADKAIARVACVQGVDSPSDLHQGAQRELRRWAHWLDASPVAADEFATARLDPWLRGWRSAPVAAADNPARRRYPDSGAPARSELEGSHHV